MTNPNTAKAAKDIPTIWPVLRFPCACEAAGATLGEEPEVMTASDSPGRVVVEDVDVLEEGVTLEEDDRVDAGSEVEGVEGAPVALVILVASTSVVVGAPMVGGRAEEKALEPGVN
jgi:hypothetical protein